MAAAEPLVALTPASVRPAQIPIAGPFPADEISEPVPANKRLNPAWVESLSARGERTLYRGDELRRIGMPIGGICAGQLYLGGDGKLWRWDIFNQTGNGIEESDGRKYANPPDASAPLEQGFAVRVTTRGQSQVRTLDRGGFPGVSFCGEYPIGFVEYRDDAFPLSISLEAFSPFIPLNAAESSLPATILQYTVRNRGNTPADVELLGWLQNAVCLYSAKAGSGFHDNQVVQLADFAFLQSSAGIDGAEKSAQQSPADYGTMGLGVVGSSGVIFTASLDQSAGVESFIDQANKGEQAASRLWNQQLIGAIGTKFRLDPGAEQRVSFVIAWHFPNLPAPGPEAPPVVGRHYATRFDSALDVCRHVAANLETLARQTRLWHETWYDSTLPHWLLDRVGANTSILATSTCQWWGNGRFWCWEGVGCCVGTCTHVWHYAHSVARLFPELERSTREMQDFGTGYDDATGMIAMRGEFARAYAADGQAGTLLRCYREHQMSADDGFLKRNGARIRKSMEFLLAQDGNEDGIIDNDQPNTLDTSFFGPNSMITSLYLACLRAVEEMAREIGESEFADRLRVVFQRGSRRCVEQLWNGEYFYHRPDPAHPDALKVGNGCFIDQVFGQSWAHHVGLGRILPREHVRQALRSLWTYNWTPDVGPYRKLHPNGRWYAMPGEAGMILCTWPKGGGEDAAGKVNPGFAGYFNECMNGFEYQVAGHMIWEGMLTEGLALTRAIHDRYHASRRNPWNEIECGDHYARSMAVYGVYTAACGFACHGPQGSIAFAPRLGSEDFRCAFTTAEGWGSFSQQGDGTTQRERIDLKWGRLRLTRLEFDLLPALDAKRVAITLNGEPVEAAFHVSDGHATVVPASALMLDAEHSLQIVFS